MTEKSQMRSLKFFTQKFTNNYKLEKTANETLN